MTLTKQDLEAIGSLLDKKLDEKLDQKLDEKLDQKLLGIRQDVSALKQDVSALKQDVSALKQDVSALKQDVSALKQDVSALKQDVVVLKQDVAVLKQDVNSIHLLLENNVVPRLNTIESCYLDTYKRYQSKISQIDMMQTDIDALKMVTKEHSVILSRLA